MLLYHALHLHNNKHTMHCLSPHKHTQTIHCISTQTHTHNAVHLQHTNNQQSMYLVHHSGFTRGPLPRRMGHPVIVIIPLPPRGQCVSCVDRHLLVDKHVIWVVKERGLGGRMCCGSVLGGWVLRGYCVCICCCIVFVAFYCVYLGGYLCEVAEENREHEVGYCNNQAFTTTTTTNMPKQQHTAQKPQDPKHHHHHHKTYLAEVFPQGDKYHHNQVHDTCPTV